MFKKLVSYANIIITCYALLLALKGWCLFVQDLYYYIKERLEKKS